MLWEEISTCPLGRSDAVSTVLFSLWQLLNVLSLKALLDSHWLVLAGRAEKCLKSKKCPSSLVIVLFWNLRHQLWWVQTICTVQTLQHKTSSRDTTPSIDPSISSAVESTSVAELNVLQNLLIGRVVLPPNLMLPLSLCSQLNNQSVLECNTWWLVTHKWKEGKKHLKF